MTTPLNSALQKLGLGDADFASECGLARGQVWAYRNGRKTPRADTAVAILSALKKRGVEMKLESLVPIKKRKTRSSS
jgi:transcriptional regulator with XRE-family HTH domain